MTWEFLAAETIEKISELSTEYSLYGVHLKSQLCPFNYNENIIIHSSKACAITWLFSDVFAINWFQ